MSAAWRTTELLSVPAHDRSRRLQANADATTLVDIGALGGDPRFTGNVGETRRLFHNSRWSMYGQTVAGMPAGDTGQQK